MVMRNLKKTALFFTPTSNKVEPKKNCTGTLKNGLRSALPAAVNRKGGALATPLLSPACHPISILEPGLCNTNMRLLLFLSAVIVKLTSVKGVYRLLYRLNIVH